ncbi:hypothetical protein DDZ18_13550 [Marinicauda salina]|uniref:Acyloxyacyl hydrolase n=1 Tax=Marinicauda salina TaxID=2135793 RepID=A0A2U2BQZ4_9PROT|nr:acyloxyacyl hydrolase [Marinicauda salina]PWE16437.1 hypothetical protein DDZ18_13550 [Marinicauda salina]
MTRLIAAALAALYAGEAHAQLDEVRAGIAAHDWIENREDGPQLVGEVLFDSPDLLAAIGAPRPSLLASVNTRGGTNLGAASLIWDIEPAPRLRLEAGFGLAWHDGVIDVDVRRDRENALRLKDSRVLLGSRWLFRSQIGADYAVAERWAIGVFYEHYSHGQILASGRNQGLDEAGVRLSYRFGG